MSAESANRHMEFLLTLRRRGIGDQAVLRAMDEVPRERFVELEFTGSAYADQALPIACGQTISQPYIVAYMTEQLRLRPHHRVLEIGAGNVEVVVGDGMAGLPAKAPFDRIIVTAAAETVPQALVDQLADGGIMLLPLGPHDGAQQIVKITKSGTGVERENLIAVRFVPLLAGQAQEL